MTAQIECIDVNKHYGPFQALKDINLWISKGSFVVLVGPSGCGKSTLLRSIAGLETISSGTLQIEGATVNDVPPRHRDIAMVFQSYALYPHMSVLGNLIYPLRSKGYSKSDAVERARDVAHVIGLSDLLGRNPSELSGGQRQRVAMGRAIIREPRAFLFDEPLSNLDAALRVHMRKEIRALHDRLGATSVYVTHDQIEAMTMADHVVVMNGGVIEQQGAPLELYDRPQNRFVAGFIGSPAMNFVDGFVVDDGRSAVLGLPGRPRVAFDRSLEPQRAVTLGLRPEYLQLSQEGNGFRAPIGVVESIGSLSYYTTDTDPEIVLVEQGRSQLKVGETAWLRIAPHHVHVFDPDTGLSI